MPTTDPPANATGHERAVTRRRLLRLAGGAGLSAALAACTSWDASTPVAADPPEPTASGTSPPAPSSTPTPGATTSATAPPSPEPSPPPESEPPLQPEPGPTARPSATPEQSPTTAAAASGVLLCRDAWGAQPAAPGGREHTISRMTIHHTAVVLGDNRNITSRLRQHQRHHQQQGWVDIAYHVGVDREGNIFELRTPEIAGDTFTSYDPAGHFLVMCEGHFDQETVTEAQLDGAALAFAWAAQVFDVDSETLRGHRDFVPSTSCPGADLYAHVTSGGLRQRIDDVLARGPADLERICGDEAAAIVRAIESGG